MHLVVTDRKLSLAEKSSLVPGEQLYLLSQQLDLPEGNYFELSPEDKKQINYAFLEQCLAFGNKPLRGKTLQGSMTFGKANVWLYHKFRLYFELINFCYDYAALQSLAGKNKSLTFYTKNSLFTKISDLPHGVEIVYANSQKASINLLNLLHLGGLLFIRFITFLRQIKRARKARYLIFNRPAQETPMRIPPDLAMSNENPYYGFLFSYVNSDTLVLEEFELPKLRTSEPFRMASRLWKPRKECPHLYGDGILIQGFLNPQLRKQVRKSSQLLKGLYPLLKEEGKTVYEQVIAHKIASLHNSSRYYLYRYFSYVSFFSTTQIERILTGDEGSPTIKSVLDAAKACKIETLGLQHGAIHPLHITYRFDKSDVAQGHPMTDKTLIWGEYWGKILQTYGQYAAKDLIVVGQARTDIIPYLDQLAKEKVLEVPKEKKLVVFASQPQRDPKLRRQAAEDVFRAVSSHSEIHLLVKLHPRETDLSYYERIAQEVGLYQLFPESHR